MEDEELTLVTPSAPDTPEPSEMDLPEDHPENPSMSTLLDAAANSILSLPGAEEHQSEDVEEVEALPVEADGVNVEDEQEEVEEKANELEVPAVNDV